jgi:hypothetical protein
MSRIVESELLDNLAPDDPRAIASRRDLARINKIMGSAGAMAAMLRPLPQPDLLVDMGSGDGRFLLSMARKLEWQGTDALAADRQDIVSRRTKYQFEQLGWTCRSAAGDIFEVLESLPAAEAGGNAPVIVTANLFLHHFDDDDLKRLLALASSRCNAFIACEPRRSPFALLAARLTLLIGANDVSRHDAVASVKAGFSERELSALWPSEGWTVRENARFPFSHCFSAVRNAF